MRNRKVFRETVITVIVIAFEEKSYGGCNLQSYGLIAQKLWFGSSKAMVSLFQNYELGLLTGLGIWGY